MTAPSLIAVRPRSWTIHPEALRFHPRRSILVPYCDLHLASVEGFPLREVVVGPNLHLAAAMSSVNWLLYANGVTDVRVRWSVIPYREW